MNDLELCLEVVLRSTSTVASQSPLNNSETVNDRGLVSKDHQLEMACAESNVRVTDGVT